MTDKIYQEKKINDLLISLDNILNEIQHLNIHIENCEQGEESYYDKKIEQRYYSFNNGIKELYILVLVYLENAGNQELLSIFKKNLSSILTEDYNGVQLFNDDDLDDTFYICEDLYKIKSYLSPFEAFDNNINRNIGLLYLENILKHTGYIIKQLDRKPKNETEVYNSVKHVIKSTFPEYNSSTEPFIKEAKNYKPDILIPSIGTAVEYKFAQDENRLIKSIEDILIDVVGYSNHHIYKIFFAVFYVSQGICTEERFNIIWHGYKFPSNWKPILISGE